MSQGQLCLVLHAHMPFIRHPEHDDFLEEGWLREAILETYIPLLWLLEGLLENGVRYRVTLSLSPTLVAMLGDPLLSERFARRLDQLCDLAEREVHRTRQLTEYHDTALGYLERFSRARRDYHERWRGDLLGAFRRLAETGSVELMTCAATHGYLPLLNHNRQAVRAQILVGVEYHRQVFGRAPKGLWLPECGYYQGVDAVLKEAGIDYSFVETHGIDHANEGALHGVYAPLLSSSGVAFFGRDPDCTRQVWSSVEGYPGDADYREYYRDVGFELDPEQLGSCAHPLGIRRNVGIKYHRVTGATETKQPYVRQRALERAAEHGRHFYSERTRQVELLRAKMGKSPIVVAPYDAELFGHWWFEGPEWLGHVLENAAANGRTLSLVTPSEYIQAVPKLQVADVSASSWGYKGYSEMWLNSSNDWIYPHLHRAADRMVELAAERPEAAGLERRALNQAARELLLAQASDWAFIMSQNTVVPYAVQRTKQHIGRFFRLAEMVEQRAIDEALLRDVEAQDNLFSHIDYRVYRSDYALPTQ